MEDLESLEDSLTCPICLEVFPGRIKQCRNGHNVCEACATAGRLRICSVCREPYSSGWSRNTFAEQAAQVIRRRQQRRRVDTTTNVSRGSQLSGSSASTSPGTSTSNASTATLSSASSSAAATTQNNNNSHILCQYTKDGCDHYCLSGELHRMRQHEQVCHFRPVACCLYTDGCQHSEIPFFDYIPHLTGCHGVKFLQGSHHLNKYVVKVNGPHKKFVRDGSTSLFILEVVNQAFAVRAKEMDDWIHVWVSFHGHPDLGRVHKAEIQYNPQYEEDTEQNLRPRNINLVRDYGESSLQDDDDDIFSGNVVATTRQSWEEVQVTRNYLSMPVSNVEYNLKRETLPGRNYSIDSWAVTVTITRELPQINN